MYARVTRFSIPIDLMETDAALTKEIARTVEAEPGSRGFIYLVDRQWGKTMSVSLWEGEQAMRDSQRVASEIALERSRKSEARVVSMESYEVVAAPAVSEGSDVARPTGT